MYSCGEQFGLLCARLTDVQVDMSLYPGYVTKLTIHNGNIIWFCGNGHVLGEPYRLKNATTYYAGISAWGVFGPQPFFLPCKYVSYRGGSTDVSVSMVPCVVQGGRCISIQTPNPECPYRRRCIANVVRRHQFSSAQLRKFCCIQDMISQMQFVSISEMMDMSGFVVI